VAFLSVTVNESYSINNRCIIKFMMEDTSVGIETGYGLDCPG
jgi:hypothetical protein